MLNRRRMGERRGSCRGGTGRPAIYGVLLPGLPKKASGRFRWVGATTFAFTKFYRRIPFCPLCSSFTAQCSPLRVSFCTWSTVGIAAKFLVPTATLAVFWWRPLSKWLGLAACYGSMSHLLNTVPAMLRPPSGNGYAVRRAVPEAPVNSSVLPKTRYVPAELAAAPSLLVTGLSLNW